MNWLEFIITPQTSEFLVQHFLNKNAMIAQICKNASCEMDFRNGLQELATHKLSENPHALKYYHGDKISLNLLRWCDYAAIRILDYLQDHQEQNPFSLLWQAIQELRYPFHVDFMYDFMALWDQFFERNIYSLPSHEQILRWMLRHPSGLDAELIALRIKNQERILDLLLPELEKLPPHSPFFLSSHLTLAQKQEQLRQWWNDPQFHLRFAIRDPDTLNAMLAGTLDEATMTTLYAAQAKGIPFFVNPYYLSLIHVQPPPHLYGSDQAIRDYVIYSPELVSHFGQIVAWEKEDQVAANKPNVAGWLIPPGNNIHRRYPDVAVLIPDGLGRTCGGLCSCCQRMYEFQRGSMHFQIEPSTCNLDWPAKLKLCMDYFENDTQLCDILITGGDALMLEDEQLEYILNEILAMSQRKKQANESRPDGQKYAPITRVRLGTRLPVYLPQRITPHLTKILQEFRSKALMVGIEQCIIQTHFATALEITPEARFAVSSLIQTGWLVTNQNVFTVAASKRGSNAKLRQVLNDIGVLPYYTFTVKGYQENQHHFTPNARSCQEQVEEKVWGEISDSYFQTFSQFHYDGRYMRALLRQIRESLHIPFVATDRHVLNLPGVGKSMNFRVISILSDGRRILEFDYDLTRSHSPKIVKLGHIRIEESKSITEYLRQLHFLGEDIHEYSSLYGYSLGQTTPRLTVFNYPTTPFHITATLANFES